MPLQARPIAVGIAVLFFFGISLVGWLSGLSPFTCCKRAMLASAVSYAAGTLAVKAVNAVLMSALIDSQVRREKEKNSARRD
ncbi:MAG TPA: hypothetical protein VMX13_12690 [Sedimentisphaerales bacterium]|nr:hypothetical protein [Sedimentisphaerales bacterium]